MSPFAQPVQSNESYRRKDARATVNGIVTLMKPPKDGEEHAFVGLSTRQLKKLSARNDPVTFCDRLKKVLAEEEGGIWAMPADQIAADRTSVFPRADCLTPMTVECFMNLVSPNLATRAAMVQNTMVEVYPVQAGRTLVPFYEVTVTGPDYSLRRYLNRVEGVKRHATP